MKTKAAVLFDAHKPFEIVELDLDGPRDGEILIRFVAAGLCHSDLHLTEGDYEPRFPIVGGHEGAGVVEEVGPGVTKVQAGDHVVCSFIPSCGHCRNCARGRANMCLAGEFLLTGHMLDGTYRFHKDGEDFGAYCMLGAFSQYAVISELSVVKVDESVPLETAVLAGCGVPTGWGSATYAGGVAAGDTTVIYGSGGLGVNAIQGALMAGAKYVVAVDPLEFKRQKALEFGATHVFATAAEAQEKVIELTYGMGADQALVITGTPDEQTISAAVAVVGPGGTVVLTGVTSEAIKTVNVPGGHLTNWGKTIKGTLFGGCNPQFDIPNLIGLYQAGKYKLDELVTTRYSLEDVNQGYQDLVDGKNIRGVIVHDS